MSLPFFGTAELLLPPTPSTTPHEASARAEVGAVTARTIRRTAGLRGGEAFTTGLPSGGERAACRPGVAESQRGCGAHRQGLRLTRSQQQLLTSCTTRSACGGPVTELR